MTSDAATPVVPAKEALNTPQNRSWFGRLPWSAQLGMVVSLVIILLVVFAPLVSSFDPVQQDLTVRLQSPSAEHWLGTDHLGRDVWTRLVYGGRFTMTIAAATVLVSSLVGTLVGATSGRIGGTTDEVTMRVVDLLLSFPDFVLALLIVASMGPSFFSLLLALSLLGWTPYARLVRGLTLQINTKGYIEAAEALGCSRTFITLRHVIPNALNPVLAMSFLRFGNKLLAVGALSYLGLGVQPPNPDWGAMLAEAQPYMQREPWLILAPGLMIFITALAVTLAGEGISLTVEGRGSERDDAAALKLDEPEVEG